MASSSADSLQRAIDRLAQSDPLGKLLPEVRLGRMKAADPGLRAIVESWLRSYHQVLQNSQGFDETSVRRLDPTPRLEVLVTAGMLSADHAGLRAVISAYEQALDMSRRTG